MEIPDLPLMPHFLSKPFYPGGAPMRMENVYYNSKNLKNIILDHCKGNSLNADDEDFVKQIYYLLLLCAAFSTQSLWTRII